MKKKYFLILILIFLYAENNNTNIEKIGETKNLNEKIKKENNTNSYRRKKTNLFSWYNFKIGDSYFNVIKNIKMNSWLKVKEDLQSEMFGENSLSIQFYPNDYLRSISFQFEKKNINKEINIFLKSIRIVYLKKFFSYKDIYKKLYQKYDGVENITKTLTFKKVEWKNKENSISFYRKNNLIIYKKRSFLQKKENKNSSQKINELPKINATKEKLLDFL